VRRSTALADIAKKRTNSEANRRIERLPSLRSGTATW